MEDLRIVVDFMVGDSGYPLFLRKPLYGLFLLRPSFMYDCISRSTNHPKASAVDRAVPVNQPLVESVDFYWRLRLLR